MKKRVVVEVDVPVTELSDDDAQKLVEVILMNGQKHARERMPFEKGMNREVLGMVVATKLTMRGVILA